MVLRTPAHGGMISSGRRLVRRARALLGEVRRGPQFCDLLQAPTAAATAGGAPEQGAIAGRYLGRARLRPDFNFLLGEPSELPAPGLNLAQLLVRRQHLLRCPNVAARLVVDALLDPLPRPWCLPYATHLSASLEPILPPEAQLQRLPSAALADAARRAVAAGLTWRSSREIADFDRFYDEFYVGPARALLGDSGATLPRASMRRLFAARGTLLWVERAGQAVSGVLVHTSAQAPDTLHAWRSGLRDLAALGATTVPSLLAFHSLAIAAHAFGRHCRRVDFGLTRAQASHPMFRHKRDLGCQFAVASDCPRFHLWLPAAVRVQQLQVTPLWVPAGDALHLWLGWTGSLDAAGSHALEAELLQCQAPNMAAVQILVPPSAAPEPALAAVASRLQLACGRPVQLRPAL